MVISVLEYAVIAREGAHMKFAKVNAVDFWFVYTVAKLLAIYLVLLVSANAVGCALMTNVGSLVQHHANLVGSLARGVVAMAIAIISVEKNVNAYHAMLPAPRRFVVATDALVCVEKIALRFVPSAIRKVFQ